MIEKIFSVVAGLGLMVGCSMATPGSRAIAELKGKDGAGRFEALTDPFTLRAGGLSVFDADGSAIVVHAGAADNMTHPTGNSGDRVACGITVAQ
jgi:hypothetical protein